MPRRAHTTPGGLSRQAANDLVLEIFSRYENTHMRNFPAGKPFAELYDVDTLEPKSEWLEPYEKVSDELQDIGFDVKNAWKLVRHQKE